MSERTGWQCPGCKAHYSPDVQSCACASAAPAVPPAPGPFWDPRGFWYWPNGINAPWAMWCTCWIAGSKCPMHPAPAPAVTWITNVTTGCAGVYPPVILSDAVTWNDSAGHSGTLTS